MADSGIWTRKQLHEFKKQPATPTLIRKQFMWSERSVLYRLGGCYAAACATIVSIAGERILWHENSEEGRLLFSLDLRDVCGSSVLHLDQNCITFAPQLIHDLSISAGTQHLKLWMGKRDIGLELRLRHVSAQELREMLRQDEDDATKACLSDLPGGHPLRKMISSGRADEFGPARSILDFAKENCVDGDGNIPVLDIVNAKLHAGGVRLRVRNGLGTTGQIQFSFSHSNRVAFGF